MRKSCTLNCGLDLLLPLFLAVALSIWWSQSGLEMRWQRDAYESGAGDWTVGEGNFWKAVYRFGAAPVLLVCAVAIVALVSGLKWLAWRRWRRVAWFGLLLLVIGPGLIANLWLKETWGRPRPREIVEFGGREAYETVFAMDFAGDGKSFPCGHATMGFYFIGAWFLLRRSRPGWAAVVLVAALAWGGLIGYTRMIQGGHFATDVVWAGAIMWVVAGGLYYLFGFDRRILDDSDSGAVPQVSKVPFWAKAGGGAALAALVGGLSLGTPYRAERDIHPLEKIAETARFRGSIKIWLGDAEFENADTFSVRGEAWGHGVPTSEIADHWEESTERDGTWRFKYLQRNSGYLTEIRQNLKVAIPWQRAEALKLDLGPGSSRLKLPDLTGPLKIDLVLRGTELTLVLDPGATLWFEGKVSGENLPNGVVVGEERPPGDFDYRVTLSAQNGWEIIRFVESPP
jgi:lipid A 4'-phosphatase